jgi:two-component SAPR family response regulator
MMLFLWTYFLNDENGVDCALKLRQLDENINLIFLTTSSEFGVKSYDVRAADYIVSRPPWKSFHGRCTTAKL